jgi:hypothetical protein
MPPRPDQLPPRARLRLTALTDQNTFDRFDPALASENVRVPIQRKLIEHTLVAPFQPLQLLTLSQADEAPESSSRRRECPHRSASKRAWTDTSLRSLTTDLLSTSTCGSRESRVPGFRPSSACLLRRAAGPHRSTVSYTMSSEAGQVTANGSPTSSDVVIGVTTPTVAITRRALFFEIESSASPLGEAHADLVGPTRKPFEYVYRHPVAPHQRSTRMPHARSTPGLLPPPHTIETAFPAQGTVHRWIPTAVVSS